MGFGVEQKGLADGSLDIGSEREREDSNMTPRSPFN